MSPKCNQKTKEKRLYTVREAANYLSHTIWGMRNLIWAGTLPVVQYGRKQWIDINDLDSFIEKNKKVCR